MDPSFESPVCTTSKTIPGAPDRKKSSNKKYDVFCNNDEDLKVNLFPVEISEKANTQK